jgi:hypothetical protein
MKYIIIILMLLFVVPNVMSYELNETHRIIGEYKILGVYTDAIANISIKNTYDKWIIYNIPMLEIETGRFYYDFNCNRSGNYTASIIFTDNVGKHNTKSDGFYCGDANRLSVGSCPTSTLGIIILWIVIVLLFALALFGIALHYPILTMISGIFFLFMTMITWTCGDIVTYLCAILGIAFLLTGAFIKD